MPEKKYDLTFFTILLIVFAIGFFLAWYLTNSSTKSAKTVQKDSPLFTNQVASIGSATVTNITPSQITLTVKNGGTETFTLSPQVKVDVYTAPAKPPEPSVLSTVTAGRKVFVNFELVDNSRYEVKSITILP